MSDNEIYISIQELVFRVSAATRSSMSEEFSDDIIEICFSSFNKVCV